MLVLNTGGSGELSRSEVFLWASQNKPAFPYFPAPRQPTAPVTERINSAAEIIGDREIAIAILDFIHRSVDKALGT